MPHFKGRSRSPSLAACFHGDRPFLPAAIQDSAASLPPERLVGVRRRACGERARQVPGPEPARAKAVPLHAGGANPSGASLGTAGGLGTSLAPCARGAVLPQEHPWGSSVIRDHRGIGNQPGCVCAWSHPPLGASLGTVGDWGPAWLCVCTWTPRPGSIPGDRGGSGTSLPSPTCCLRCLPLAWGAWRQLSHGTPAASHVWGPHSKTLSPPMPVVTFVKVTAGRVMEACPCAPLPCPGTPALRSPGPALFFCA